MKLIFITSAVFVMFVAVKLGKLEKVTPSKATNVVPVRDIKYGYECICIEIYEPVCANDGRTYPNSCFLNCARRQQPGLLGVCEGECPCCKPPYQNEPLDDETGWGMPMVEGAGGMPFGLMGPYHQGGQSFKVGVDKPEVSDAATDVKFSPSSVSDCICTQEYAPVCGSNNKTYGNLCGLNCAAKKETCLTVACKGECPCCSCSSATCT